MPRIPRTILDEMIGHAREGLPNEACGLVHAKDGALHVHRVTNRAASPYRYEMDPQEQLNFELQRDRTGEALFAIYHSHVASEARPSPTDERMAFFPPGDFSQEPSYPDTYYILISLANPDEPSVRAFRIRKGDSYEERVLEEPIEIV